jgi:Fe-S-cluster-containing hydrogenase component 2
MSTEKILLAVPEKCTACNRCLYACSAAKEGSFRPSRARLHINNFGIRGFSAPSVCFQCPKPECLEACPEEAISKNAAGVVLVDAAKCDGCGACVPACPYGMIEQYPGGQAYKCDHCGGDPACVKECSFEALLYVEADGEALRRRGAQMKQRQADGSPEAKRHALGLGLLAEARP